MRNLTDKELEDLVVTRFVAKLKKIMLSDKRLGASEILYINLNIDKAINTYDKVTKDI